MIWRVPTRFGRGLRLMRFYKAYTADERVIEPLRDAQIEPVIPSKANRQRPLKARSPIEICPPSSSSFGQSLYATTKLPDIFTPPFNLALLSSGLVDDRS